MIYEYSCPKCEHRFDVVKPASQMTDPEGCPTCGAPGDRQFVPSKLHITGAKVSHAEYNPALGKVIRNKAHLKNELAKHEGRTGSKLVEIGNDFKSGEKQQKYHDNQRAEKMARRWQED